MEFTAFRRFLLDRGMVYFYAIFIAGYFLLPMASGHRKVYYILVLPAVLLLWRELASFYRGNSLALLLLLYGLYMMSSLLWTADYEHLAALQALGYTLCVLSFCYISGYLWIREASRMDRLAHRATWLAAAAAVVSIVVWYLNNPFPFSRLEPLGAVSYTHLRAHENKEEISYAVF